MTQRNPFEVLKLDPTASEELIVKQAGRLRQRAKDDATLTEIRQAVQTLTGNADDRLLQAMLTHPRPSYTSTVLERLTSAFRRAPTSSGEAEFRAVFDKAEFHRQLLSLVASSLEVPPQPFEELPFEETSEEIRHQMEEMHFQSLIHDPRA